jgi:hypothetical protein
MLVRGRRNLFLKYSKINYSFVSSTPIRAIKKEKNVFRLSKPCIGTSKNLSVKPKTTITIKNNNDSLKSNFNILSLLITIMGGIIW